MTWLIEVNNINVLQCHNHLAATAFEPYLTIKET